MGFSEIELRGHEMVLGDFLRRRRPPPHLRAQVDLHYKILGQSIEIFEVRPAWDDPTQSLERSFAKTTFVRSRGHWNLFWMRRDLRWHRYPPAPIAKSLHAALELIDRDDHHCFFG